MVVRPDASVAPFAMLGANGSLQVTHRAVFELDERKDIFAVVF